MISIVDAYKNGLLHRANWWSNILSGIILAVVALPLSMAFAIASGAKPEQGLYTAIISAFIVGLFGGSRIQIAGPTGAFVVILANITAQYGIVGLQLASLMAGAILICMGLLRLGNVIKFIPDPVIVGFTSGIGVVIFVGQWKDFFGLSLSLPINANFYQKLFTLLKALIHLDPMTTALAVLSLILIIATPKIIKRIPGPLIALLVATILQSIFHFKSIATLGSVFGGIPQTLPKFQFPLTTVENFLNLIGAAFTVALLGAIESLLSATAADGMVGTRHNSNQELIGQGIANIFTPLFGGFAATGAIARTATNIRNGGNSPIAAIVHSAVLLIIIVLLAPLAFNVPLYCLAAILFVVSYNMSDFARFIHIVKSASHYDTVVLVATFLLTVFTNLVLAVNIGIVLAMLFFVRQMYQTTKIYAQPKETLQNEFAFLTANFFDDNVIYEIQGPLFFGVAKKMERALLSSNTLPKTIIFRLKDVPFMDSTGITTFNEIIQKFHKKNVEIYVCETNSLVAKKLADAKILTLVKNKNISLSFKECYTENFIISDNLPSA